MKTPTLFGVKDTIDKNVVEAEGTKLHEEINIRLIRISDTIERYVKERRITITTAPEITSTEDENIITIWCKWSGVPGSPVWTEDPYVLEEGVEEEE